MSDLGIHVHGGDLPANAKTFVLLHAGVADAFGWEPVAERLARAGCRSIVPDLRGFGTSLDAAADFRHADDVLELLDELDVTGPCVLVGWSMSGTVAVDLAVEHPSRWTALALVCSVPKPLPRSAVVDAAWELEEQLLEAGDIDGAIRNDVQTWGAGPGRSIEQLEPAIADYMIDVARDQLARDERSTGEALDGDRGATDRIGELTIPVLVVTAQHDTPCHEDAARVIVARAVDGSHVHVLDAAHMAPMEQPDVVADALWSLLKRA